MSRILEHKYTENVTDIVFFNICKMYFLFVLSKRWIRRYTKKCITLAMECSFQFGYVSTIVLTFLQVYFARSDSH